jgi:hypothetical protein
MAMTMLGLPIEGMGSTLDLSVNGIYHAYLALPIRNGFYTINYKVYSKDAGAYWSLDGVGFNPELVSQVPAGAVIGNFVDPTNIPTVYGLWSEFSQPWVASLPWLTPSGGNVV